MSVIKVLVGLLLGFAQESTLEKPATDSILVDELRKHVEYLASDELEGRGSASPAELRAALWIQEKFTDMGAQPGLEDGSYLQRFDIGLRRLESTNRLVLYVKGEEQAFPLKRAFLPILNSSPQAEVEKARVVFVGYGISSPEQGYDDYDGIEVTGKIAIALRGRPSSPDLEFDSDQDLILTKARVAAQNGALGLLIVDGPARKRSSIPAGQTVWPSLESAPGQAPFIEKLAEAMAAFARLGETNMTARDVVEQIPRLFQSKFSPHVAEIPVISVSRLVTNRLLLGNDLDLGQLEAKLDNGEHASCDLEDLELSLQVAITQDPRPSHNVVARVEGNDDTLADEIIVVGAHYDHVGRNDKGDIWHGADDNASGTAVLLEVAEALIGHGGTPRTLYFVAFGSEEQGLLGSSAFVNSPPFSLDRVTCMVNLDMVGRGDGGVYCMGTRSAQFLDSAVKDLDGVFPVDLKFSDSKEAEFFDRSDHANFYDKKIPVVFFTTDIHADYHRPTDTADKIHYEAMRGIAKTACDLILTLGNTAEKLEFISFRPTVGMISKLLEQFDTGSSR